MQPFVHGVHCPQLSQVVGMDPLHPCSPGVHTGEGGQVQLPQLQFCKHVSLPYVLQLVVEGGSHTPWPVQPPPLCQVPMLPHVCVSVPQLPHGTGFVSPGAHTPVHTPEMHVFIAQAMGLPHAPVPSQVSTPLPEHCVWPEAHTPWHAPETHVWFPHEAGMPHVEPLQVSTPLPEHCVAVPVHAPWH
jgi:hypothetical protein